MRAAVLEILLTGDARQLDGVLSSASTRLTRFGSQMQTIGRGMTAALTAPIVGIGALALKSSIDFESAFAGVQKTVEASASEFSDLRDEIIALSRDVPSSASAIAKVVESAGQLGIANENLMSFTRTIIDLSNTTNMSADDAATSLARIANVTKMSQEDFSRLGSAITAVGNDMVGTESETAAMALRLASAGSQVGLTVPQILGLSAALVSVGIEAEAGGSAISRVMAKIATAVSTGGQSLQELADIAGMSSDEFKRLFAADSMAAIMAVVQGFARLSSEGENLFGVMAEIGMGDVRVGNAMRSLAGAGDLLADKVNITTRAFEENTALAEEANKRYKTTAAQLAMVKNGAQAAAIGLGDSMLPVFKDTVKEADRAADSLGKLAKGFAALPPDVRHTIFVLAGLLAALGPVLYIGGKIAKALPIVLGLLKGVPAIIAAIRTALTVLGGAGGGPLAFALAATWSIFYAFKNWDKIKSYVDKVGDWVDGLWHKITGTEEQRSDNLFTRLGADAPQSGAAGAGAGPGAVAFYEAAITAPARDVVERVIETRKNLEEEKKKLGDALSTPPAPPNAGAGHGGSRRGGTNWLSAFEGYSPAGAREMPVNWARVGIPGPNEMDAWFGAMDRAFFNSKFLDPEQRNRILDAVADTAKTAKTFGEEIADGMSMWLDQAADAIWQFVRGSKTAFKDMVDSILADLARLWIRMKILEPIARSIGLPGYTEARASSGYGGGQGMQVTINNNAPGVDVSAHKGPSGRDLEITVRSIVNKQLMGGEYDASMGMAFGARRVPVTHG